MSLATPAMRWSDRESSGLQLMCCLGHFQRPPIHRWSRDHRSRDILSESITSTLGSVLPRGTFIWCMVAATTTVVRLARVVDASGKSIGPLTRVEKKKTSTVPHIFDYTKSRLPANMNGRLPARIFDQMKRKTIESQEKRSKFSAGYRMPATGSHLR